VQFYGHGVHEQKSPALVHNIFLIYLAPYFVVIEILYWVFGYRKQEIDECEEIAVKEKLN